jgi:hypothetical protein
MEYADYRKYTGGKFHVLGCGETTISELKARLA